jgi:hypothetical protein
VHVRISPVSPNERRASNAGASIPVISARLGVAVALLLAVAGVAIGTTAFFAAERKTGDITGRLVQSRATNEYDGPPLAFPLDDFYIGRGTDGVLHAFYAYPPGYFGHVRGCKLVWDSIGTVATPRAGPGLYVDLCGGARFDKDGKLVSGPADRNLDYFATTPAVEGLLVDTRTLYCGSPLKTEATTVAGEATPTPTSTPETPVTCERVSPNTKRP